MKSFKTFLAEQRISTRYPTGVMFSRKGERIPGVDDPTDLSHRTDMDTMKRNRKNFEANMDIMKDSTHYQDIDKSKFANASHDDVAEHYIEHFKKNILHVHDSMPTGARQEASRWYEGAHHLSKVMAEKHGIPHHVASAVIAALSPQNEWNNNIALAERTLDIYHNHQNHSWSPQMEEHSKRIWKEKDQPDVDAIRGKKLSDLERPVHKAMWIRTYDEAHNPRSHYKITPSGEYTNTKNTQTKWQAIHPIAKSVSIIESKGDVQKISELMGLGHKIRNFYNNIQTPHGTEGDVTVDTHAVAAAHLKPFSSNSMEVNHAFGTTPAKLPSNWVSIKKGGAATGINGTDPMYEEAYRRASHERGILPRQMQSIAWEGVRAMYPSELKKGSRFNGAYTAWSSHHAGEISDDHARKVIDEITGGGAGNKKYGWE